ncbi:MAG: tetratricopeptide repeat-containing sensor histidine kinase [Balneolaceae bacterium]
MLLKIFILIAVAFWGFGTFSPRNLYGQNENEEEHYFILNTETGEFLEISRTSEAIDSLLSLGNEMRNRNSRISYHAAREALVLSQEIGYWEGLAGAYNLAGIKYLDFGEYEYAMDHFLKAIEIQEQLDNEEAITGLLNNIALVHIEEENYDKAAEYLLAGVQKREALGQQEQAAIAINNLGVLYRRQGIYDEAMIYFRQAEKLSLETDPPDSVLHMIATLNIGNTYRNQGELNQAVGYMEKAKEYFERKNYQISQIVTNLVMGELYRDRQEFDEALQYAYASLELAQNETQRERIKDAHELIAKIHEDLGSYQEAYFHFQMYHELSDTLLNLQRSNQINEMQVRFEVDQKNREIELLNKEYALQEAEIAQQVMLKRFLLAGMFSLLVIVSLLFYTNRERKKNNRLLKKRRKEIEIRNKQLAQLNKEKDEFLSIAAHDLRNPLSAVKSVAELIEMEENPDKDLLKDYTNLIQMSADRMLNLINNLLNIQSINEGVDLNITERIDVKESLQQSLRHFGHSADAKNIQLVTRYHHQNEFTEGNTNNLIRVFDNLISNAVKYSPHNTVVNIRTGIVNDKIRISIHDEGPGIPAEDQKKLFGRFTRLSNRPTGNESSTGLGLYIAKKLTTSMNGSIWCESKPGKGTVFYVEFPSAGKKNREEVKSAAGTK